MFLHAWRLYLPFKEGGVCVTTRDPFPHGGEEPRRGEAAAGGALWLASDEDKGAIADESAMQMLRELWGEAKPSSGVSFSIYEPAMHAAEDSVSG